jgi:S-disulfanyl-L-cysteine oxidoreductase SoxD
VKYRITFFSIWLFIISCQNQEEQDIVYYNDNIAASDPAKSVKEIKQLTHLPAKFDIGRKADLDEIKAWDIDIRPDGKGLPAGSGDVATGKSIFAAKCAACHGKAGEGAAYSRLAGVIGDTVKAKTIGNYWPWSTTLFDYTRRAMPYNMPGSLKDDEVYSLTAYLLYLNKIIDSTEVMNAHTLPRVVMPARQYFVVDDRRGGPEVR